MRAEGTRTGVSGPVNAEDVISRGRVLYGRLMAARGSGLDAADRHVLASAVALAAVEGWRPLPQALGLDGETLARLLDRAFPGAIGPGELAVPGADAGEDADEEPDYRRLLLGGRAAGSEVEDWLARIVARRSMRPEHLWISLGLGERRELSDMLLRHFPGVARRNTRGMRWKKFFYREMCEAEGLHLCKSPVCDTCPEYGQCFGVADG